MYLLELYFEVGVAAHHEEKGGVQAAQVAVITPRQPDHLPAHIYTHLTWIRIKVKICIYCTQILKSKLTYFTKIKEYLSLCVRIYLTASVYR